MKNFNNSDYALNKYSEGIVYRFADEVSEINLESYLAENSGKTEEDFRELKALSDVIYLEQVTDENRQTRNNGSINGLEETEHCAGDSLEDKVIEQPEREAEENKRHELALQALDKLTEVQRHRYIMHHAEGLTTREIAEKEGASQRTIMDSIQWAEKKNFLKILKNDLSKHIFFDIR